MIFLIGVLGDFKVVFSCVIVRSLSNIVTLIVLKIEDRENYFKLMNSIFIGFVIVFIGAFLRIILQVFFNMQLEISKWCPNVLPHSFKITTTNACVVFSLPRA